MSSLENLVSALNDAVSQSVWFKLGIDIDVDDPSHYRRAMTVKTVENSGTPTQYEFYISTDVSDPEISGFDFQWVKIASIGETELEWSELEW